MPDGKKKFYPYKKPELKLQTTTLWEFPSQHYGSSSQGDKEYKGATPSYVIWNLLERSTMDCSWQSSLKQQQYSSIYRWIELGVNGLISVYHTGTRFASKYTTIQLNYLSTKPDCCGGGRTKQHWIL